VDAAAYLPLWNEADRQGVPVVVTLWSSQLPGLRRMLDRFPALKVSLDHCAFPRFDPDAPNGNVRSLLALSEYPALSLKVTTHVIDACEAAGAVASRFLARLVSEFGAERVMWGSDYSQTHDRGYDELVDTGRRACSTLADDARSQVLGGAAERLWWHPN
jgi:L-fuconolactonase